MRKTVSVALLLILTLGTGCATGLPGDYCDVAPNLTPKRETFDHYSATDPVFTEQVFEHWALLEGCEE